MRSPAPAFGSSGWPSPCRSPSWWTRRTWRTRPPGHGCSRCARGSRPDPRRRPDPGNPYRRVIRSEPTGSGTVTWGEFVQPGFLHESRTRGVSLQKLRRFIDGLRAEIDIPYPLAHSKPLILNRELVVEAQKAAGLGGHPVIYQAIGGQYIF